MNDILTRLYAAKARALAADEEREPLDVLIPRAQARRSDRRSFRKAVARGAAPAIVAEIKRASPSRGLIVRNMDPAAVARAYAEGGADAISVLTETDHFLGDIAYLDVARRESRLPILRKDFLTSRYGVVQSAAYGADAILAIVAGLDDAGLRAILAEARLWDLDVLVEVHDEAELWRALEAGAQLVGINNRDLRTFETDLGVSETLLPVVPHNVTVISESGITTGDEVVRLWRAGACGFLIGETLMEANDPKGTIAAFKDVTAVR